MPGPTHQFCPNCSAMLPPHLRECPRCGQDLEDTSMEISTKEIFQLTGVVVLLAVVPFVLLIGVAVLCVMAAR